MVFLKLSYGPITLFKRSFSTDLWILRNFYKNTEFLGNLQMVFSAITTSVTWNVGVWFIFGLTEWWKYLFQNSEVYIDFSGSNGILISKSVAKFQPLFWWLLPVLSFEEIFVKVQISFFYWESLHTRLNCHKEVWGCQIKAKMKNIQESWLWRTKRWKGHYQLWT